MLRMVYRAEASSTCSSGLAEAQAYYELLWAALPVQIICRASARRKARRKADKACEKAK